MEDKLAAYEQRKNDRKRFIIYALTLWIIFSIIAFFVSNFVPIAFDIFIALAYVGFLATFVLYKALYPREKYEIEISASFSEALSLLKLSEKERGRAASRHRRRAANYIERALQTVNRLFIAAGRSEIMEKEMCVRLNTFKNNVKKFVLPRVLLGEDLDRVESSLNGFSKFFADQWESLGIGQLDAINQNVQNLGKPSKEIKALWSALRSSFKSKPITLGLSLVLGFGVVTLIIFGILTIDATQWIRANVGTYVIASTAMSGLIAGIFLRS